MQIGKKLLVGTIAAMTLGGGVAVGLTTTQGDTGQSGRKEAQRQDNRQPRIVLQPGDDRGGREVEPADDRGREVEPGKDRDREDEARGREDEGEHEEGDDRGHDGDDEGEDRSGPDDDSGRSDDHGHDDDNDD